jgi:hypothetical protein
MNYRKIGKKTLNIVLKHDAYHGQRHTNDRGDDENISVSGKVFRKKWIYQSDQNEGAEFQDD